MQELVSGEEHLLPSQEDQRIQGGPAGLVHPAGKHRFKVSRGGGAGTIKPLTLEKPDEP